MKAEATILLIAGFLNIQAQTPALQNPSFEGIQGWSFPGMEITPNFYTNVGTGTLIGGYADVLPSSPITLNPSDGQSYGGASGSLSSGKEGISQALSIPLLQIPYQFLIDLATPSGMAALEIWGGNYAGHQGQLLWTSPVITSQAWTPCQASFLPSQAWPYITFYSAALTSANHYILYDHIRTGILNTGRPPINEPHNQPNNFPHNFPNNLNRKPPSGRTKRFDILGRQLSYLWNPFQELMKRARASSTMAS